MTSTRRRLLALALAASAIAAALAAVLVARGGAAASASSIVFVRPVRSRLPGVDASVVSALAGGGLGDVTHGGADVEDAVWSPDGSWIAFLRRWTTGRTNGRVRLHAGIFTMRADGSERRELVRCGDICPIGDLAWSPDGRRLAFVRSPGGRAAIGVMDADGGGLRYLCGPGRCGPALAKPVWSPDGSRIAFSNQGVLDFLGIGVAPSAVWVAAADGSSLRKLTDRHCRAANGERCTLDTSPAWSPDGSTIAFSRAAVPRGVPSSIELVDAGGGSPRAIFGCRSPSCTSLRPVWAPGGRRLAVATGLGGARGLRVVDLHGRSRALRTCAGGHCLTPADVVWSPDGSRLAFDLEAPVSGVYVVAAAGGPLRRVAARAACCLAWLPRALGSAPAAAEAPLRGPPPPALAARGRIAFTREARPGSEGRSELDTMRADGRRLRRVVAFVGPASSPSWSRDGARIVFAGSLGGGEVVRPLVVRPGGRPRPLLHDRRGGVEPSLSPDGRGVAFASDRGVVLARAGGRARRHLTRGEDPAWSPQGGLLALSRPLAGGRSAIVLLRPGDGRTRRLTVLPGEQSQPDWSPDGRSIAFVWWTAAGEDLYRIGVDGRGLRRLTDALWAVASPSWAPDGRTLAFSAGSGGLGAIDVREAGGRVYRLLAGARVPARPAWRP